MSDTRSIDPSCGDEVASYAGHDDAEIERRLDSAVRCQRTWRERDLAERARVLEKAAGLLDDRRDELAMLVTTEMGKLIDEARGEIEKCASVCRYYARNASLQLADEPLDDEDRHKSLVSFEPLGVVLAIMPWNFPFWQLFRAAAPALMAGNTVLLKHASSVTGCALAIETLLRDAGLPAGGLSVLVVAGSRASDLARDDRIAAATLTGSEAAGGALAASAGEAIKPTVLELGGSDPFVVLDLEVENVVGQAVTARFMNAGQSCIAAKRFIVLDAHHDEFVERLKARIEALVSGDPRDPETTLAPMARHDLRAELHGQVGRAVEAGAECVCGGRIPDHPGAFHEPTLLVGLPRSADIYREELFGPVACVFRAGDAAEAVEIANDSPFGLGGSVWGGDVGQAIEVARQIESGAVYVNRIMASDPRLPFGGIRRSGYGRELGTEGIRSFVNRKTLSINLG